MDIGIHTHDERQMVRALVHQCLAVQLAMREIRQVNPGAQLVQTEDLGRVWSTPSLRYQADYENERRWLSLDLLWARGQGPSSLAASVVAGADYEELDPFPSNRVPRCHRRQLLRDQRALS